MKSLLLCLFPALLLSGCGGSPPRSESGPTPAEVVASGETRAQVHWGGRIVAVTNLKDRTLIEVLGLPLDRSGRPRPQDAPQGRFLIEQAGFLDPHEYAADRLLAVEGRLDGFARGAVGEASYRYPVVLGEKLMLWPARGAEAQRGTAPRINFGVGVSNHGGGVGVGIGF
jgi:outer membrane lipoprotein